jgi:hypothetical protein
LILDDGEKPTSLDMLREAAGAEPGWVLGIIKECIRDEIELGSPGKHREALEQCDRPEFMTYLCGKMGAM